MGENEPDSILIVTPHPDDSESGAGGTIARWCAEGKKVVLVVCTNAGCSFSEAVVDGVFGGISDIVATIISEGALASITGV